MSMLWTHLCEQLVFLPYKLLSNIFFSRCFSHVQPTHCGWTVSLSLKKALLKNCLRYLLICQPARLSVSTVMILTLANICLMVTSIHTGGEIRGQTTHSLPMAEQFCILSLTRFDFFACHLKPPSTLNLFSILCLHMSPLKQKSQCICSCLINFCEYVFKELWRHKAFILQQQSWSCRV